MNIEKEWATEGRMIGSLKLKKAKMQSESMQTIMVTDS